MKSLEGGLNPDDLSSEKHLYGGAFELDFIPLHFRRGIRHAGTDSHIELPTMLGQVTTDPARSPSPSGPAPMDTGIVDGMNDPIDVKDREGFGRSHLFDDSLTRLHIDHAGHLYEGSPCSPHSFVSMIMFSQTGF